MARKVVTTARFNGGAVAALNENFAELYSGGTVLLQSITNTVAGPMAFAAIPAGFNRLVLKGRIRGSKAAVATDILLMTFNGDATQTNYYRQLGLDTDVAVTSAEAATSQIGVIAAATARGHSIVEINVEGYAGAALKGAHGVCSAYETDGAKISKTQAALYHDSMVAAITALTLYTATDGLLGTMHLYGEM